MSQDKVPARPNLPAHGSPPKFDVSGGTSAAVTHSNPGSDPNYGQIPSNLASMLSSLQQQQQQHRLASNNPSLTPFPVRPYSSNTYPSLLPNAMLPNSSLDVAGTSDQNSLVSAPRPSLLSSVQGGGGGGGPAAGSRAANNDTAAYDAYPNFVSANGSSATANPPSPFPTSLLASHNALQLPLAGSLGSIGNSAAQSSIPTPQPNRHQSSSALFNRTMAGLAATSTHLSTHSNRPPHSLDSSMGNFASTTSRQPMGSAQTLQALRGYNSSSSSTTPPGSGYNNNSTAYNHLMSSAAHPNHQPRHDDFVPDPSNPTPYASIQQTTTSLLTRTAADTTTGPQRDSALFGSIDLGPGLPSSLPVSPRCQTTSSDSRPNSMDGSNNSSSFTASPVNLYSHDETAAPRTRPRPSLLLDHHHDSGGCVSDLSAEVDSLTDDSGQGVTIASFRKKTGGDAEHLTANAAARHGKVTGSLVLNQEKSTKRAKRGASTESTTIYGTFADPPISVYNGSSDDESNQVVPVVDEPIPAATAAPGRTTRQTRGGGKAATALSQTNSSSSLGLGGAASNTTGKHGVGSGKSIALTATGLAASGSAVSNQSGGDSAGPNTNTAANTNVFSNPDESISTNGNQYISYAPAVNTYLERLPVPELIERVKAVLLRDNLKQKDLAQFVGISGSTLSPLLKHKYMHTKVQHLQTLIEWLLARDREFVSMINSRIRLLGVDSKLIVTKLSLTVEQWAKWLALEDVGGGLDRSAVDSEIGHLISGLTRNRMGGGSSEHYDELNADRDGVGDGPGLNGNQFRYTGTLESREDDMPNNDIDKHFTPINPGGGRMGDAGGGGQRGQHNLVPTRHALVQSAFPSLPRHMLRSVVRIIGNLRTKSEAQALDATTLVDTDAGGPILISNQTNSPSSNALVAGSMPPDLGPILTTAAGAIAAAAKPDATTTGRGGGKGGKGKGAKGGKA